MKKASKSIKAFLPLTIFILVFLSVGVLAQPPFVSTPYFPSGLVIEGLPVEVHQVNTPLNFTVHVHNYTNGVLRTAPSVSCAFDLNYLPSGQELVHYGKATSTAIDFEVYLNSQNFTMLGQYSYFIWCNNTVEGGHLTGTFDVTPTGTLIDTARSTSALSVLFAMLFLTAVFGISSWRFSLNPNMRLFAMILFAMMVIFLAFTMHLSYIYMRDFVIIDTFSGSLQQVYSSMLYLIGILVFVAIVIFAMNAFQASRDEAMGKNTDGWDMNKYQ